MMKRKLILAGITGALVFCATWLGGWHVVGALLFACFLTGIVFCMQIHGRPGPFNIQSMLRSSVENAEASAKRIEKMGERLEQATPPYSATPRPGSPRG